MRSRRLLLVLLTALFGLATVSSDVAQAQGPKRGGTLRVSYGNDIANLDFHTASGYVMEAGKQAAATIEYGKMGLEKGKEAFGEIQKRAGQVKKGIEAVKEGKELIEKGLGK